MLRMFVIRQTWLVAGLLLGLAVSLLAVAGCPEGPNGDDGETVKTGFGDFTRKTILKGDQPPAVGFDQPSHLKFGPDGRLWVTTFTGSLYAISLNTNHDVVGVQEFRPVGNRLLTGIAFDPLSPLNKPVLYLVNNDQPIYGASDLTGRVTRITGIGTAGQTVEDIIVGLPRSAENHMTFDLEFGSDGRLYICQGGNTNNGSPSAGIFANRAERPLSAAILAADVRAPDFSGASDLEVYAPGLRNPYTLAMHHTGRMYTVDQGSNKGFGGRPNPNGSGSVIEVPNSMPDELDILLPGKYYGHPNPARNQLAFQADLPDGTPHQAPLTAFPAGAIVTGVTEYTPTSNQSGKWSGVLLATGFVDGHLYYATLSEDGLTVTDQGTIADDFANPLDVTVGPDGTIYILEAGGSLAFGGMGASSITMLEPVETPDTGFPTPFLFAKSDTCAACHSQLSTLAGTDVSISGHWQSTMMANAARDPLFRAKVASEVARTPAAKDAIEAKCATCHFPMARTQAIANGTQVSILDTGFLDPAHPLNPLGIDGVSCSLCHQIQDTSLGEPATFSGNYRIDQASVPPNRYMFGPFAEPKQSLMQSASGFVPIQGRQTTDAGLCATCHTLYTQTLDAQGKVLGEFPEQTPYLEWEHSDFGDGVGLDQTCQECHMPNADGPAKIASLPPNLLARDPFAQHHFVGGNSFMVGIHKQYAQELGMVATPAQFDATIARTLAQLQTRTAELSIAAAEVTGDLLTVDVDVVNLAGHKAPTGYPSRRAWIHLKVTGAGNQTVFESGASGTDGYVVGDDAAASATAYEPHYDLITEPNQVQIYEAVMQDTGGEVTHTLTRAATYAKDNRLLPQGFDKQAASADIMVHGDAADDDDFIGGSDQVTYQIDVTGQTGPFTVTAVLLYQSVPPVFVDDLRTDSAPLIDQFLGYYDAADKSPVIVASQQTIATVSP